MTSLKKGILGLGALLTLGNYMHADTVTPGSTPKTPKKIVIFDFDNVIAEIKRGLLARHIMWYAFWQSPHKTTLLSYGASQFAARIKSLIWRHTAPTVTTSSISTPTAAPRGTTYTIYKYLQNIPKGQDYFGALTGFVNKDRQYVQGMQALLERLSKDPNVLVVIATNKDSYAFRETDSIVGASKYASLIFINDTKTPLQSVKEEYRAALTRSFIQDETPSLKEGTYGFKEPVYHYIPTGKPAVSYFTTMFDTIENFLTANKISSSAVKEVLFIDDKQANLQGFTTALQAHAFKDKVSTTILFNRKKNGVKDIIEALKK